MNRPLDIDFYIGFFSAIPEKRWITGRLTNYGGQYCAIGLCQRAGIETPASVEMCEPGISIINDEKSRKYPQRTPKKRVLAYLEDVKAGRAK